MRYACAVFAAIAFLSNPALADRPVTADEGVKLGQALAEQGCSGGKHEFDDGKFEVDDAKCSDGKTYDLDFDASYKLIKKKLED
jgi:hypothetical protein